MKLTDEMAYKISKEHIEKMNPRRWSGNGRKPKSFDARIATYDIGSNYDELDISFDYEHNPNTGKREWMHCCELREKKTGRATAILHGYGVDSEQNLADTIYCLIRDELGNEYE